MEQCFAMQTNNDDLIVSEVANSIALVTLNRAAVRNALNQNVRRLLAEQFEILGRNPSIRCIVLTGGAKVFAAGADLSEISECSPIDMHLRQVHRLWQSIRDCPKPIIAAVNGYALGGGCELAMHADIIVAGRTASFLSLIHI